MWKAAIQAVKSSDDNWIVKNRNLFHQFFEDENDSPLGKLREAALEFHYEEKLFKLFLSRIHNGLELPLDQGSKWIENCSILNPNWGWLMAIGVGGAYFADYIPTEIVHNYFTPREALVAGSGKPTGTAVRITGERWLVNGYWNYCSGSEHASLYTAVTTKNKKISALILPREQVRIIRDWNAIGLNLTCSHTIQVENASIPENHFFDLTNKPRPSEYPLSTYPFKLFAQVCFIPVVTGITRAFLLESENLLELKKTQWKKFETDRYEYLRNRIKEYSVAIADLKSKFYHLVEQSWKDHLEGGDINEKEVSDRGVFLANYCYTTVAAIVPELGMGVLEKEHPLQRLWQDLQTAYQHSVFRRW